MKESQIIKGCQANDRRCQRAFVDEYSSYLFGVCRRYIEDAESAKDCLQNALVHILKNIGSYQEQGAFRSWAARVTATQCLQHLRREKKHINYDLESSPEPENPEEVYSKMELDEVMTFLDTLPTNYRVAVNMFIIEGYSHKEIAETLNITESSSRSLVARARKMIQEAFSESAATSTTITTIKKIRKLA